MLRTTQDITTLDAGKLWKCVEMRLLNEVMKELFLIPIKLISVAFNFHILEERC